MGFSQAHVEFWEVQNKNWYKKSTNSPKSPANLVCTSNKIPRSMQKLTAGMPVKVAHFWIIQQCLHDMDYLTIIRRKRSKYWRKSIE